MKYSLVVQWPASTISDYDEMIRVENALEEMPFASGASVDGHDMGSDETNIFIDTDNPSQTFEEIKAILSTLPVWTDLRAAYRESNGEEYTIVWPADLTTFNIA